MSYKSAIISIEIKLLKIIYLKLRKEVHIKLIAFLNVVEEAF